MRELSEGFHIEPPLHDLSEVQFSVERSMTLDFTERRYDFSSALMHFL